MYGMFFGGMLASVHDVLKKPLRYNKGKTSIRLALLGILVTGLAFYVFVDILGLNSIIAHIIPPLFVGIIIVLRHKDFLGPMLICSFISTFITFVVFQILFLINPNTIGEIWLLENLTGLLLLGIPIEEYVFAASLGFAIPFFYESIRGIKPIWK